MQLFALFQNLIISKMNLVQQQLGSQVIMVWQVNVIDLSYISDHETQVNLDLSCPNLKQVNAIL